MTAIPDDVMTAAKGIAAPRHIQPKADDLALDIARVILSERRRCALLARKWKSSPHKDESFAANSIADQIMAGGK